MVLTTKSFECVQGLGFRAQDLEFRVCGSEFGALLRV